MLLLAFVCERSLDAKLAQELPASDHALGLSTRAFPQLAIGGDEPVRTVLSCVPRDPVVGALAGLLPDEQDVVPVLCSPVAGAGLELLGAQVRPARAPHVLRVDQDRG